MPPKLDILVVGDAMVDITVKPRGSEVGGANPSDILLKPGGLANVAVAASSEGAQTGFLGRVGNDIFGDFYEKDLSSRGVLGSLVRSRLPTGICVNFVGAGGERTMYTDLGANRLLASKDLDQKTLESTQIVFISGFSMECPETAREILEIARRSREAGRKVAVGGGASNLIRERPEVFSELVEDYCDYLILNESEATVMTDGGTLMTALDRIRGLCDFIVVTRGPDGSIAIVDGETSFFESPRVKAVDTTGAGDVFAGVLLTGIAGKIPLGKAMARAHLQASRSVTYFGPRASSGASKPE